jgi:hypothetical protein
MTKARAKTNAKRNAGQKNARRRRDSHPEASHDGPHQKNLCRNTKPSAASPVRETAEGLDYRFLRSQPRVIGLGLPRRARPQQSDYNTNTQLKGPIINASLSALQIHTYAKQSRLRPLSMAAFNLITYGRI